MDVPVLSHIFKKRDKGGKARAEAERINKKQHGVSQKEKLEKIDVAKKEKIVKKPERIAKKVAGSTIKTERAHLAHNIVVRPHISEKSVSGNHSGKYVFEVHKNISKQQIAQAVEIMYGVKVESVNKVSVSAKRKRYKGMSGKQSRHNKAIVTLKKGQGIEVLPQ